MLLFFRIEAPALTVVVFLVVAEAVVFADVVVVVGGGVGRGGHVGGVVAFAVAFELFHEAIAVVGSGEKAACEHGGNRKLFEGAFLAATGFGMTEHSVSP